MIVHDISEPTQADPRERREHDTTLLCEVFDYLGLKCDPKADFKFVTRAGAKTADKIRPVIVGMREVSKRDKILANSYRLRNNREMANVRILPDLTKKQREEDDRVGKEVEKRNSDLEQSGDRTHHWRIVGQKGARTILKTSGARQQGLVEGRGEKRGPPDNTGSTPPPRRQALNR